MALDGDAPTMNVMNAKPKSPSSTLRNIAVAMQRVTAALRRRPDMALQDDAPAAARWVSGTRVVSRHANGTEVASDMPVELGGSGDQVSPGWLFRAGLASCAATRIVLRAAAEGIELTSLEVSASSRSDTRGLLGMVETGGEPVSAGPRGVQLVVRIRAEGIADERLRELVEDTCRGAPISSALQNAVPLAVQVDVGSA